MAVQERPPVVAGPERRAQLTLFARNFFKHPRMLGSIIPSSSFLIRRLLEPVDWERARVIVEYGPGVGTITHEILGRLHPDATLVVIETNDDFVDFCKVCEILPSGIAYRADCLGHLVIRKRWGVPNVLYESSALVLQLPQISVPDNRGNGLIG